jgi:hypothetical protein
MKLQAWYQFNIINPANAKVPNAIFIRKRKKYQKLIFTQPNRWLIDGCLEGYFLSILEISNPN